MCGRCQFRPDPKTLKKKRLPHLDLTNLPNTPRCNLAPTRSGPVILQREDGGSVVSVHRWGLLPPWAESASDGSRMINARAETVHESRPFVPPSNTGALW